MPPFFAAAWMARACSILTASGFSIITWMPCAAHSSTTRRWSNVLREHGHRLRFGRGSQFGNAGEEQFGIQVIARGAGGCQLGVFFHNTDELHVGAGQRLGNESVNVAVNQADDGEANGRLGVGRNDRRRRQR